MMKLIADCPRNRHLTWLVLGFLAYGCAADNTGIRLTVDFPTMMKVDQLRLEVRPADAPKAESRSVPEQPKRLDSGVTVRLLVPEAWDGLAVQVRAEGLRNGEVVGEAAVKAVVRSGQFQDVVLTLALICTKPCTAGQRSCLNDGVRTCIELATGGGRWGPSVPCPSEKPYCSNGLCDDQCNDECPKAGPRRCGGSWTLQTVDNQGDVGDGALAIDGDDQLHIAYRDIANKALKYARICP